MRSNEGFFTYSRLKKFGHASVPNFFILRICFESFATLILEIVLVCFCELLLKLAVVGLLLYVCLLRLRLLSLAGFVVVDEHVR